MQSWPHAWEGRTDKCCATSPFEYNAESTFKDKHNTHNNEPLQGRINIYNYILHWYLISKLASIARFPLPTWNQSRGSKSRLVPLAISTVLAIEFHVRVPPVIFSPEFSVETRVPQPCSEHPPPTNCLDLSFAYCLLGYCFSRGAAAEQNPFEYPHRLAKAENDMCFFVWTGRPVNFYRRCADYSIVATEPGKT
jgi:hypothetical protein